MKIKVGDLVKMIPKNYSSPGIPVRDQWKDCTGIITKHIGEESYIALLHHPEESGPIEILIRSWDIEVIGPP